MSNKGGTRLGAGVGSGVGPGLGTKVEHCLQPAQFGHFTYIDRNNETKLLAAVQNEGPVSIVLQATEAWQHYSGGILDQKGCGASGSSIDHAVLAVGYGVDSANGKAYWIVKNSWGSSWGEDGYVRLAFNEGSCNLGACFSYFVKTGPAPPPGPPGPGPPGPGPAPGPSPASCPMAMTEDDCTKIKTCHWCKFGGMGFCREKDMQCP